MDDNTKLTLLETSPPRHTMHTNNADSQTPTTQQPLFVDRFAMPHFLMAQQHQCQYRAPSSAPSRNKDSEGRRKAEARYPNHFIHESSGMIACDHSTGIHPVYAQIGTSYNPGAGGVWRPPSGNTSMVDRNSRQRKRTSPYDRNDSHSSRTRRLRTDHVHPSMYEIIGDSGSTTAGVSNAPIVIPAPMSTWAPASSTPAPPTSTPAMGTSTGWEIRRNMNEQPGEDDGDDDDDDEMMMMMMMMMMRSP